MQKDEAKAYLERRIRKKKEELRERGEGLILSLQKVNRSITRELDNPTASGVNVLGELQASATIFEAACGYLAGLVQGYKALISGDGDGGDSE